MDVTLEGGDGVIDYDQDLIDRGFTFHIPRWQFSKNDGICLLQLMAMVKPKMLVEVGCWTGHSTSYLATAAKKNDGLVFVIDTFNGKGSDLEDYLKQSGFDPKEAFKENMKKLGLTEYVTIMHENSHRIHEEFMEDSIDFMFVDGAHKYSLVKKDLDRWWPKIKEGGIFCGHDCESMTYDERFIEEDHAVNGHNGVIKAVTEKFPNVKILNNRIWWVQK